MSETSLKKTIFLQASSNSFCVDFVLSDYYILSRTKNTKADL